MNLDLRLKISSVIVTIGVVLSIISHYTSVHGLGVIYPFFSWKLYTQPVKTGQMITDYRIYSQSLMDTIFRRNSIVSVNDFSDEEYSYTFNALVNACISDTSDQQAKKKLIIFLKHVVPDKKAYKIVSESYTARDLYINDYHYDTSTVISF